VELTAERRRRLKTGLAALRREIDELESILIKIGRNPITAEKEIPCS
jgi:hypothetical protein